LVDKTTAPLEMMWKNKQILFTITTNALFLLGL